MKKILLISLLLLVIGATIGYKIYNKPHEDMASAKAGYQMPSTELFAAFQAGETTANEKYLDKTIQVTGKVVEVKKNEEGPANIILEGDGMFGVACQLDEFSEHKRTGFQPGEEVTFKCKCTGLLMDVIMVRCVEL